MSTMTSQGASLDIDLEKFGRRIKMMRQIQGVTQMDLAKAVGYKSTGAISQVENGSKGMKWAAIQRAADFFSVSPYVLLSKHDFTLQDMEMAVLFQKLLEQKSSKNKQKILGLLKEELTGMK